MVLERLELSAMTASCLLGVDIGGTTLKATSFGPDGAIISRQSIATQDNGTDSWLARARELVLSMLASCPPDTRAGVAAPGLAAPDGRSIAHMPGRLRGLENLNWQKFFNSASRVPVLNDAHAALLGETWIGAAKGVKNVFLLTLGTGIGGAAIVDGHLLRGHLGRAGHLGHISLDPRGVPDIVNTPCSLEDAVGEHTVARRSSGKYQTTLQLLSAVRAGDPKARSIWLESIQALGVAIAGLINVLDPELVLIGGGIADANDELFGPLKQILDKFEWRPGGARVRVMKAALGPNAGAAGAAYAAAQTE